MSYRNDSWTQGCSNTLGIRSTVSNPPAPRILPSILWVSLALFTLFGAPSYAGITANSDVDGITVEFDLPDLRVTPVERNGVTYQSVSYRECGFTSEQGNPAVSGVADSTRRSRGCELLCRSSAGVKRNTAEPSSPASSASNARARK